MSKSIITLTTETAHVNELADAIGKLIEDQQVPVIYNVKVDKSTRTPLELFRTDVQLLISATILKDPEIRKQLEHTYTVNLRNYGLMRISERLVLDCKKHCEHMNIKCIVAGDNLVLTIIAAKATLTISQADLLVRALKQQEQ